MALDFLKTDGINAYRVSGPRSVYPITVDGLAEIEIRVPENDAERAAEIIAVRFSETDISGSEKEDHED